MKIIEKIFIYRYHHTASEAGKHGYVGQTTDPQRRHKQHHKNSFRKSFEGYNFRLSKAIRKHGIQIFQYTILEVLHDVTQKRQMKKNHTGLATLNLMLKGIT